MLALVALWINASEFEQLLQIHAPENLNTQSGPTDLASFDDSSLDDLLNFINHSSS